MPFFRLWPLVCVVAAFAAAPLQAQDLRPAEKVVLQLKWKHQFQLAGYYAALKMGDYRDAGFGAHPFRFGGLVLNNTLSAGVAAWPDDGGAEEELLRAADRALYRAKSGGRNRAEAATPAKERTC
jgi:GGDEF domain-containing protein